MRSLLSALTLITLIASISITPTYAVDPSVPQAVNELQSIDTTWLPGTTIIEKRGLIGYILTKLFWSPSDSGYSSDKLGKIRSEYLDIWSTISANTLPLIATGGSLTGSIMSQIGTNSIRVSGSLQVANDSSACTSSNSGAMRYSAGYINYCNGVQWASMGDNDIKYYSSTYSYVGRDSSPSGTYSGNGVANIFIGNNAGRDNTSGSDNIAIGRRAGTLNTNGANNIFLGNEAGYSNQGGSNNVGFWYRALGNLTSGRNNIAIGWRAWSSITTWQYNTIIWDDAGMNADPNSTRNVLIGAWAGGWVKWDDNVFIGSTGGCSISCARNIGIWQSALSYGTTGGDNIAMWWFAGYRISGWQGNIIFWPFAGWNVSTGSRNIFMWDTGMSDQSAGDSTTTWEYNLFLVGWAGTQNIGGSYNIALWYLSNVWANASYNVSIGNQAGYYVGNGGDNISIGRMASSSSNGAGNIAIGLSAGGNNTSGARNIAIGQWAQVATPSGNDQLSIGNTLYGSGLGTNNARFAWNHSSPQSTFEIFSGGVTQPLFHQRNNNLAYGLQSLYSATGDNNIGIGRQAGFNLTTGQRNIIIWQEAGLAQTGASDNVFLGYQAGYSNTSGENNFFIGEQTGRANTTGLNNLFAGWQAWYQNTTGQSNIFFGSRSGFANTIASHNIFAGYRAGYVTTTGGSNQFLGFQSGYSNIDGAHNIFQGYQAGYSNISWGHNIFIGRESGFNLSSGSDNVFLGRNAGLNVTSGSNNVLIGNNTNATNTSGNNQLNIGNSVYGSNLGQWATFALGLNTTNPAATLDIGGTTKIGTNGSVLNNIIKTAVTIDPPSIAANSSSTQSITITNLTTNAAVSISPNSTLPDGIVISYVRASAANTLEVKFYNATSSVLDPASIVYQVAAIQ